jgi:mannose-6-phosphate isomerase-like protein (cupin superfamily)
MPFPPQQNPINLTATAETMSWPEVQEAVRVFARSIGYILEIRALDDVEAGHQATGMTDTVYVVIAGYGVLHNGDTATECTAGDVLFVPRGHEHWFERLDGAIRIWRISLEATAAGEDEQG